MSKQEPVAAMVCSTEVELKLLAEDLSILAEIWRWEQLGDWSVVGRGHERQHNVYFDTDSGALGARGATLRWRRYEHSPRAELTLKAKKQGQGDIFSRLESTVEFESDADPRRDDRAAPIFEAASQIASERPAPFLELVTDRHNVRLRRGASLVGLALDVVTLPGTPFVEHEVEAELEHGRPLDLHDLRRLLLATGRLRPARHGKRSRATRYLSQRTG